MVIETVIDIATHIVIGSVPIFDISNFYMFTLLIFILCILVCGFGGQWDRGVGGAVGSVVLGMAIVF
jgi:hypothetical protein